MDPSKDSEVLEESAESTSLTATASTADSSVEINPDENDRSGSRLSLRAVLVPTEDSPLFGRETIRRPFKTYQAIMKSYTSSEVLQDSTLVNEDGSRTMAYYMGLLWTGCRLACIDLFKCYQNFAVKFRNSKFIYVLQILLLSLPISALWMSSKYSGSCPGSPDLVTTTGITGFFGLLLVGQWMVIKCCSPENRPCEGQQKCFIMIFFMLVVGMLELEIYYFNKKPLSFEPTVVNYCNEVFCDYTYRKFIAAFVSMFLVVLLYFPDYSSYVWDMACNDPITGSCYKAMEEEEDCNHMQQL